MKHLLLLCLFTVMTITCATAQSTSDTPPSTQEQTKPVQNATGENETASAPPKRKQLDPEQLVAQLGLDEEQEEAFLEVWDADSKKLKAIREEYKDDRSAMREKMMEYRQEREAAIAAVLTPEQNEQLKEIMKKYRKRGSKGGKKGRGKGRGM